MPTEAAALLVDQATRAYLDFITDARGELVYAHWGGMTSMGQRAIDEYESRTGQSVDDDAAVRATLLDLPPMATFFRLQRTLQEATWQRIIDACAPREADIVAELVATESRGPGSVRLQPAFRYPEYATVDIHIQPGGYTGHPLAGLIYDLGTQVFFGGGKVDAVHESVAQKTAAPLDRRVERIMDIGCSIGQMTCALKHCFPAAEVRGTDISGPMVHYAHWRAVQRGCDVHFAQMPAEALDVPDGYFDLVVAHILFHELPVGIIERVVTEAYRVLRPGGAFVIWDFPTATDTNPSYANFMGIMDGADNGEPYALGFVHCGLEDIMKRAGFTLRSEDPTEIHTNGRIGDKTL